MNFSDDIRQVRDYLSDWLLIAFTVLALPTVMISLNRIPLIGWRPVMGLHIVAVTLLATLCILRKKIAYGYKAGFVVFVFYSVGAAGILQFGLIAGAIPLLVIAAPATTLFFGLKKGITMLVLILATETLVGFLIISGNLHPDLDLSLYAFSSPAWTVNIFGVVLSGGALTALIHGFNGHMIRALQESRQYQNDLKKHQRELEKTIEERTKELQQSNDDLEKFARIAAHDMRSPLNMISGYAQLLALEYHGKLEESGGEYLNNIIGGVQYASDMIDDLLDYSEINKDRSSPRRVDMNAIVAKIRNNLSVDLNESGTSLVCDDLPPVFAVETQIMRVVQNLISNSIKYRATGRPLNIHITAEYRTSHWKISVRDNGIGIATEHHERIFEMFQRVEDQAGVNSAGIGLAACKRIIERHGGQIWVESLPGQGSTFHFTLRCYEERPRKN